MASFWLSSCTFSFPLCKHKLNYTKIRSHSLRDDGTSANIVDANLGVLRERIIEVNMKEKLETSLRLKHGWNYQSGYDCKHKRSAILSKSLELMGFVSTSLGLVFLGGTFCICLVSLVVHLSK